MDQEERSWLCKYGYDFHSLSLHAHPPKPQHGLMNGRLDLHSQLAATQTTLLYEHARSSAMVFYLIPLDSACLP